MPGKKLDNDWAHLSPAVTAAYQLCLDVEKELMDKRTSTLTATEAKDLEKKLVNIRILGYLLIFGPSEEARGHVAKTILIDKDDGSDAVVDRGGFYDQVFLRAFRKVKGRTPQVSHHSRPSYRATLEDVKKSMKKHPTNHAEAKKSALVRDNFRCILTGTTDLHSYEEYEELQILENKSIRATHCAHIFSESTNVEIEEGQPKREYSANAWAVICAFGYNDIYEQLGSADSDVHRLENIMTLEVSIHDCFDNLKLWFEAEDTPNLYKVCASIHRFHTLTGTPEQVEFKTEIQGLPLPSPRYLEIHAAVCRIAHMSGAADYYRDLDDDDPFVAKFRSMDPVGSDFPVALHARLLDLSEQRAATVSG